MDIVGGGSMPVSVLSGILVFIVMIVILAVTRKLQVKRTKEVLKKFEGKKVLGVTSSANFFGQESLGYASIRGNGVLVVTEDELYFEMWSPKKEFRIPLTSILTIETPKSHLGRTRLCPLLKIIFQNEKGEEDSMAWAVRNVHERKRRLEEIIKAKRPSTAGNTV